jgi:hypothetical protein
MNKPTLSLFAVAAVVLSGCPTGSEPPGQPVGEPADTAEPLPPGQPEARAVHEGPTLAGLAVPPVEMTKVLV